MKLWTKEIEKKAKKYPIYSQDGKGFDSKVLVKYFNPYGAGTWIITEASQEEDGDWLLFGYMHITDWEWGYVMLSQLQELRVPVFGCKMPIERDLYIDDDATVSDLIGGIYE